VRVRADRVDELGAVEQVPELGAQRGDTGPRGVDVHPHAVLPRGLGHRPDGIDRAGARRADRRADEHRSQPGGDVGAQGLGERVG
jgi:hypothetical protein